jgi:hypothetical protein
MRSFLETCYNLAHIDLEQWHNDERLPTLGEDAE